MFVFLIVASAFLALTFVVSGYLKVIGAKSQRDAAVHFGFPYPLWRIVGVLEVAAVGGLLLGIVVRPLSLVTSIRIILLMGGATASHIRARDPFLNVLPPITVGALAVTILVMGLTLR